MAPGVEVDANYNFKFYKVLSSLFINISYIFKSRYLNFTLYFIS